MSDEWRKMKDENGVKSDEGWKKKSKQTLRFSQTNSELWILSFYLWHLFRRKQSHSLVYFTLLKTNVAKT